MPGAPPEPTLPTGYLLPLVEAVEQRGIDAERLLAGSSVTRTDLGSPTSRTDLTAFAAVIDRAADLTGEPLLSLEIGLRMRAAAHGFLGFAAMTAGTVGEALALADRFIETRTTAIALVTSVEGDTASLRLEERVPLGEMLEGIVIALFTGLWQIGNELTGQTLSGSIDVSFARRDHYDRLERHAPGPIRYGCSVNRLVFPATVLDLPIRSADPVATQLAREQCERELEALRADGGTTFEMRVRGAILPSDGPVRGVKGVAKALKVSERTLKRRLGEAGTSFSALRDEVRLAQANRLLADTAQSVDRIAATLGYSDAANFTRAYKRWTGLTPGAARKRDGG